MCLYELHTRSERQRTQGFLCNQRRHSCMLKHICIWKGPKKYERARAPHTLRKAGMPIGTTASSSPSREAGRKVSTNGRALVSAPHTSGRSVALVTCGAGCKTWLPTTQGQADAECWLYLGINIPIPSSTWCILLRQAQQDDFMPGRGCACHSLQVAIPTKPTWMLTIGPAQKASKPNAVANRPPPRLHMHVALCQRKTQAVPALSTHLEV